MSSATLTTSSTTINPLELTPNLNVNESALGPPQESEALSTASDASTTTTTKHPPNFRYITDRSSHDGALQQAQEEDNPKVTLLFVTSISNPACQAALPKVMALANTYPDRVVVYQMELTRETAPMIKFGIQNTPIFVFIKGFACETVLGYKGVEEKMAAWLTGRIEEGDR